MPFTPFHFGAHSCAALPFQRRLDIPAFLLANVFIDIEPLAVMLFNLNYPLHGYAHTFLGGAIVGSLNGSFIYLLKRPAGKTMSFLRLSYKPTLRISIISGVLGAWLHIFFDAAIYIDIRPFYPIDNNPLYGLISPAKMYLLCALLFIPVIILYFATRQTRSVEE